MFCSGGGGEGQALLVLLRWICAVGKPSVLECAVGFRVRHNSQIYASFLILQIYFNDLKNCISVYYALLSLNNKNTQAKYATRNIPFVQLLFVEQQTLLFDKTLFV